MTGAIQKFPNLHSKISRKTQLKMNTSFKFLSNGMCIIAIGLSVFKKKRENQTVFST